VFQKQNPSATTDLKILQNATEPAIYSASLGSAYQQAFAPTVTVAAGDTIDFSVGWGNGNYSSDGSVISVTIGQPVTECQAPLQNLLVSLPAEDSAVDVQSGNTNGFLTGNAKYEAGVVGRAFDFDGNGDYVVVPDNASQQPVNALAVEGWFKFRSAGGIVSLIAKPIRNSTQDSYTLYMQDWHIARRPRERLSICPCQFQLHPGAQCLVPTLPSPTNA
jgi:hypothetical protein